jgi:hypothetical protein
MSNTASLFSLVQLQQNGHGHAKQFGPRDSLVFGTERLVI